MYIKKIAIYLNDLNCSQVSRWEKLNGNDTMKSILFSMESQCRQFSKLNSIIMEYLSSRKLIGDFQITLKPSMFLSFSIPSESATPIKVP